MSHRIERVNNLIRQELSELLQRTVKDPRLSSFVAVTEVATSPDLKHAKIYVSRICSTDEREETLNALYAASGFFHKELTKRLRLRRVPELNFQWDDSIERGVHLLNLIDSISDDNPPE